MNRRFRPVLVAICSCVLGLLIGIAVEIVREKRSQRVQQEITQDFERRGESPPQMVDVLKPSAYPMLFSAAFGVAGTFLYLVYYVLARRSHET